MSLTLDDFANRFEYLKQYTDTSTQMIHDLLSYSRKLETTLQQETQQLNDELRDCRLDLTDAIKTRRELQQQVLALKENELLILDQNNSLKNRNPYICMLIDGDGLIFQEQWIKQGIEGGKRAAYALRAAVVEQCSDRGRDVEIVAKIVANLGGLSKAMQRDGSIVSPSDLKDFTLGFTQAKASFDFIDVGYGKERADSKIRELIRWNLSNHNCKQILLGISHDSGYAPFLDEILQDEMTRQRVMVIEGVPVVPELVATNVRTLNLGDDLFRRDKLVDRMMLQRVTSAPVPVPAPTLSASPASTMSPTCAPAVQPPVRNNSISSGGISSYAKATKAASPPPQMTLPLGSKTPQPSARKQATPAWNPGPRGLDPPIEVDYHALETVKKRKDTEKFCNNHYLRGPCIKPNCSFEHKLQPTKEEIKAISKLTRLNPCTNGQYCEEDDCIYGHHCQSMRDGWCMHPHCRYDDEAHPPGTKYKTQTSRLNY